MRGNISRLTVSALVLASAGSAVAQGLPTAQPRFLHIVHEQVKLGRGADHAKFEAGWPAAFEKAKFPYYYLALAAVTGSRETWYVTPLDSQAAFGDLQKREDDDAVLGAELERLSRGDAVFLDDYRVTQAMARPDLSHGEYPDLTKARFWEITTFRVRPGHEAAFAAVARAYAGAASRGAVKARWRTYEVVAGAPSPTYYVFASLESFGEFDQALEDGATLMKNFSADDAIALQKFSVEGLLSAETNRFRLDPAQSYVARELRAQDPAFWGPKRPVQ
jgi:hypothetical protein